MVITPAYTVAFVLVFAFLSVRALLLRKEYDVGVGFGDKPTLQRAVRAHGNFAEYVPLTLIVVLFVEGRTEYGWAVHGMCVLLLIGRLVHAFGISQVSENYNFRRIGMGMTFTSLSVATGALALSYAQ